MKKLKIFTVIMFVYSFTGFAQTNINTNNVDSVNYRQYEDRYLLPRLITDSVFSLDVIKNTEHLNAIGGSWIFYPNMTCDRAVQFNSDTAVTIDGVSAFFYVKHYGNMNAYLCIADSNFNILRKAKIPSYMDPNHDSSWNVYADYCRYTELFFDTSVTVQGKFFVILDNPKPYPFTGYNWDKITAAEQERFDYRAKIAWDDCQTNVCDSNDFMYYYRDFFVTTNPDDPTWEKDTIYQGTAEWKRHLSPLDFFYMFPILAEKNQSSGLEETGLENQIAVFPNPAKDLVSVKSPERIISIEINNSLGQTTDVIAADDYTKTIDVKNYPKGSYIISIKTAAGSATKKLIIK